MDSFFRYFRFSVLLHSNVSGDEGEKLCRHLEGEGGKNQDFQLRAFEV
jgi:hypothetical protein